MCSHIPELHNFGDNFYSKSTTHRNCTTQRHNLISKESTHPETHPQSVISRLCICVFSFHTRTFHTLYHNFQLFSRNLSSNLCEKYFTQVNALAAANLKTLARLARPPCPGSLKINMFKHNLQAGPC